MIVFVFVFLLIYGKIIEMKNIVILGIDYEYNIHIAELLTKSLDMYFLDVNHYLSYSLFSRSEMLAKCGLEYLNRQENLVVKSCADFENTIMCIPYNNFFREEIYKNFLEKSYIIYLYFSKEKLQEKQCSSNDLGVDLLVFDDRNNKINNICNKKICIGNKKDNTVINEILNLRGEYEC